MTREWNGITVGGGGAQGRNDRGQGPLQKLSTASGTVLTQQVTAEQLPRVRPGGLPEAPTSQGEMGNQPVLLGAAGQRPDGLVGVPGSVPGDCWGLGPAEPRSQTGGSAVCSFQTHCSPV